MCSLYTIVGDSVQYNEQFEFRITESIVRSNQEKMYSVVNMVLENNQQLKQTYDEMMEAYFSSVDSDRLDIIVSGFSDMYDDLLAEYEKLNLFDNINVKQSKKFKLNIGRTDANIVMRTSFLSRFFIFSYISTEMVSALDEQRAICDMIAKDMTTSGVTNKFFDIVNAMVMATQPHRTGKAVWTLLETTRGYSYDAFKVDMMTSIFKKAIPGLDHTNNPIAYIILILKNELSWLLRTPLQYTCITTDLDILDVNTNAKDIYKSELFYKTIIDSVLCDVVEAYAEHLNAASPHSNVILTTISHPLVCKIFGVSLKDMSGISGTVLNCFSHMFLDKNDKEKQILLKLCLANIKISHNIRHIDDLPEELSAFITNRVANMNYQAFTGMTLPTIKKLFTTSIFSLYRYEYYDIESNERICFKWTDLIIEYMSYIYNIVSDGYSYGMADIRKKLIVG